MEMGSTQFSGSTSWGSPKLPAAALSESNGTHVLKRALASETIESAGEELAERGGTMTATAKITKRSTMQEVLRARRRLAETA